MTTSGKTAIVTGGAGFIGSHMVDLLVDRGLRGAGHRQSGRRAGSQYRAARQESEGRRSRSLISAIISPAMLCSSGVDYVFHFAGIGDIVPSIERPMEYMSANVQGTVHMLECARQAGVGKFVYAASSSCYGLAGTPTREDHPIDPQYPYALSKYQGEQAVFHWQRVYKLPVNSIRIFNAYGTRSRTSGAYGAVFGVFLKQKLAGKPFTVVGDGTQTRDFLYVTDVASGFFHAAETEMTGEVWNLGAGNPQSVNRLVELLGGPVVHIPKRPGEPDCTWADIGKITRDLGWRPKVNFEEGVGRIVAQIDYWRDAPLWDSDSIAEATSGLV